MIEQRLVELEIKFSYQEDLLHTLNTIVTQQQQEIARLEQTCKLLNEHINHIQAQKKDEAAEPPPPHY
ncbi:MAG: SlyX family protein [Gammaproteobacteria bacterium]|nr:SlyX family protein [Gammaproteobacteria bacterium]